MYNTENKKNYVSPAIELVNLDREISLALASDTDPFGEPVWTQAQPTNNDPFHTNIG